MRRNARGQRRSRVTIAILLVVGLTAAACTLKPIDLKEEKPLALRSTVTAADGTVLAQFYNENRSPVRLGRVSPTLIDAILAAEDNNFFEHPGYDLKAIARALIVNLRQGEIVQGGSTITQQYVKNTYFRNPPKTFARKIKELRFALEVEKRFTKKEILERYLNIVYLGHGAYGVKAATETYFDHGVKRVTPGEAALLAGLIRAPSETDPYRHPQIARTRRDHVLDLMVQTRRLSAARARRFKRQDLPIRPEPPITARREPYFVEAVRQEILSDERFGANAGVRDRLLHEGGLQIETTLVPELQRQAERAIASVLNQPGDPAAALVALQTGSGKIVAMVGGQDWSNSQVNLALGAEGGGSGRQAGSSFKTLTAAAAMEAGIPLHTMFESAPAIFDLGDGQTWQVDNYTGLDYGKLPLDEALIRSINGVYARLALTIGGGAVANQAQIMGVRSNLSGYPSIALGATDVSVMDMAAAYSTLANKGVAVEPTTIERVVNADGGMFEPEQQVLPGAMSAGNAYLLTATLEQVIERGTGMAADIGRPAAGKTGTTDDYSDAWFVGYTPQITTAVWVGYPEQRIPMTSVHGIQVAGGTLPAQIWQRFMSAAHEGLPVRDFELPRDELQKVLINPKTGLLAAPWCAQKEQWMLRSIVPTETCPKPPPKPDPTPSPSPDKDDEPGKPSPSPSSDAKDEDVKPSPSPGAGDNKEEGKKN
jgi:penicillin-binding protein 1A